MTRAVTPGMRERRSGHLVFVSSLHGKVAGLEASVYCAAKFGLRGFASALREELRDERIGVTTILPGFIRDAGMFHASGVGLPPAIPTRSPQDVAKAVVRGIEGNKPEIVVAPFRVRMTSAVGALAPMLVQRINRAAGANRIAREVAVSHRDAR